MHRAIKQLLNDHQIILGRLDDLERALNAEFCHPGAAEAVRRIASFFDGEFLAHIAVEERALYSEVGEALGAKDEPIRQMLEEHQEIRRLAGEFVAAARALDGSLDRFAVAARWGREMNDLLREHIYKEDYYLFPIAEKGLLREHQFDAVARRMAELHGGPAPTSE